MYHLKQRSTNDVKCYDNQQMINEHTKHQREVLVDELIRLKEIINAHNLITERVRLEEIDSVGQLFAMKMCLERKIHKHNYPVR